MGCRRPSEPAVIDVSVEVATLLRLLGVPVVVVAMPGERVDAPHTLVYQLADHILAAWPQDLYVPRGYSRTRIKPLTSAASADSTAGPRTLPEELKRLLC